ncbi:unnamed protein product [Urochloa decumbens]|uniref:Uncharacterized protein n=1 Tax=Urochloa decumbens TaxID=240449 RepID=A0ABC9EXD0_9POAL
MSSACPSFILSCSNISCSIWFCCGGDGAGSKKEPEQDAEKQYQPAHAQLTPPPREVITVPDHLKPPSGQKPPELPPPPPPAAAPAVPQDTVPPRQVPSTETHYPPPTPTQQQTWPQTLLPPSVPAPTKVHDSWPPSTQMIPSGVQSMTMMHKPPPQAPWPARQPSKTTYQAPPPEQQHLVPPHLPFNSYQAAALPQALPPGPLLDSTPFMEYCSQEHPEYFVQGSY